MHRHRSPTYADAEIAIAVDRRVGDEGAQNDRVIKLILKSIEA